MNNSVKLLKEQLASIFRNGVDASTEKAMVEMPRFYDGSKDLAATEFKNNLKKIDLFKKHESKSHKNIDNGTTKNGYDFSVFSYIEDIYPTVETEVFDPKNDYKHIGSFKWFIREDKLGYQTEVALVHPDYQGNKISTQIYTYMIDNHFETLFSDSTLTGDTGKGSFQLWQKLGKMYNSYIYVEDKQKLIEVDGFDRDDMLDAYESFVVSTEKLT